jgi:hypothetical protein
MNFSDIYKKIRSIDEDVPANPVGGTTPQPTAPTAPTAPQGGAIPIQLDGVTIDPYNITPEMEKALLNAQYVPPSLRAVHKAALAKAAGQPAAAGKDLGNGFTLTQITHNGIAQPAVLDTEANPPVYWIKTPSNVKPGLGPAVDRIVNGMAVGGPPPGRPTQIALKAAGLMESINMEECGDMMPHSPAQQDIVDMNVTLHGSGPGGIRDLMSILRDIEGKDSNGGMTVEPHAGDIEVMLGDMEEEYGNSVRGASGAHTASIQDVTNVGTPTNGGDHKPRQAGLPQANAHMHETVKSRLQQQYDAIKQEGAFTDMADTKLGDMPGKLATGAKQMYNKAATAVGKAATAVANTTPRQIGQGISDIGQKAADQIQASTRILPNAPRLPGVITDKFPKAAGQPAQSGQAGQPAEEPAELNGMRESTDFARVKHLTKILNG